MYEAKYETRNTYDLQKYMYESMKRYSEIRQKPYNDEYKTD